MEEVAARADDLLRLRPCGLAKTTRPSMQMQRSADTWGAPTLAVLVGGGKSPFACCGTKKGRMPLIGSKLKAQSTIDGRQRLSSSFQCMISGIQ
jgi:hypothetical protein